MKKITNSLLIAGAIVMLTAGCKGKDKVVNDPKAVVVAFFERMAKKDFDGAAALATKDSKATLDMMKKAIDAAEKMCMKGSLFHYHFLSSVNRFFHHFYGVLAIFNSEFRCPIKIFFCHSFILRYQNSFKFVSYFFFSFPTHV